MAEKHEIGGYFELELNNNHREYHPGALKLNSGRYCLQYILRAKKYKKIFLPSYICDSVLQPVKKEKVLFEFYPINQFFEPVFEKNVDDDECFLYVNYFGINSKTSKKIASLYKNVIIDNSQAFFEHPLKNTDTFYSARKFFGVPDGAYLYCDMDANIHLNRDISLDRMNFLLKRIENSAQDGYPLFQKNEAYFDNCGMKKMSKLTERMLNSIDYETCRKIRNRNFLFLDEKLSKFNVLDNTRDHLNGPMIYPFMNQTNNLKEKLIEKKIYVATYWNDAKSRVDINSFENKLANFLLPLPIDQRYNLDDMKFIVKTIHTMGV
jgi:hypothetical protein